MLPRPMTYVQSAWTAVCGLGLAAIVLAAAASAEPQQGSIEYHNPRFGFVLSLPGDIFVEGETRNPDAGTFWTSRDGQARLVAGAQPNDGADTLQAYRKYIMETTYPSARFDYAPVRETWFVLSGTQDGQMFYERVTFACGGRYIYGWQLTYPADQRARYDRVVEAIHRGYRAGRGEDGACGE